MSKSGAKPIDEEGKPLVYIRVGLTRKQLRWLAEHSNDVSPHSEKRTGYSRNALIRQGIRLLVDFYNEKGL